MLSRVLDIAAGLHCTHIVHKQRVIGRPHIIERHAECITKSTIHAALYLQLYMVL